MLWCCGTATNQTRHACLSAGGRRPRNRRGGRRRKVVRRRGLAKRPPGALRAVSKSCGHKAMPVSPAAGEHARMNHAAHGDASLAGISHGCGAAAGG